MRVSVKMSTLETKFLVTMVLNRDMTYDSTDPFLGGRATATINLVQKYYPWWYGSLLDRCPTSLGLMRPYIVNGSPRLGIVWYQHRLVAVSQDFEPYNVASASKHFSQLFRSHFLQWNFSHPLQNIVFGLLWNLLSVPFFWLLNHISAKSKNCFIHMQLIISSI